MEGMMTFVQPFFTWLLQTTLIGSVIICLILLIQKMLGGRLGPRWCHALWLILLMRMILPWAPSSRLSLFNLVPSWDRQIQPRQLSETTRQQEVSQTSQTSDSTDATPADRSESVVKIQERATAKPGNLVDMQKESKQKLASLHRALPILWLAGAIVIGAYILVSDFALWRIVKRDHPLINQEMLELFEECKTQMDVQSLVAVVPSDQVRSPGLFGFVRPRLLLPREMLDTATREEMRYVFMHELAHLKRRDIYLGWLTSLLQILHWFNPLIWFAFYRMRTDRELACDALVLTRTGQEKSHEYGGAIVGLLRRLSRSRRLPAMAGIVENRSQLKRRMTMIAQYKKKSYQWSPLAIVLIIALACISLPNARGTKASETSPVKSAHEPNFRKIRIPSKPDNGVLSPDGKKLAFVSKGSIWVVPVHGKVGPDIAGEPVRLTEPMGAWNMNSTLAWSGDGEWIAFNANYNVKTSSTNVYVISSSGGDPKRIPIPSRRCGWPEEFRLSLSPDGKTLAYASLVSAGEDETEKPTIFTIPVNGGEAKQLTGSWTQEPAFSPDGCKVAYVKNYRGDNDKRHSDVWVIPASGGIPVQVSNLHSGQVRGPVWSPDGKMIACHRRPEGKNPKEIWIIPISENGEPTASPAKIELPLETFHAVAGWTPNNKIGIQLMNPWQETIYSVPSTGGIATQITPEGMAAYPKWNPDGSKIFFRWYKGAIGFVSADGGEVATIPIRSEFEIYEAVPGGGNDISPDGKTIVFSGTKHFYEENKKQWEVDIFTIPIEGGEPIQLTSSGPAQDRFPCWSPDGKSVAFIRPIAKNKEPIFHIHIVSKDGRNLRHIATESDKVSWAPIDWSPDGKSITYFSRDKKIKSISIEGGESHVLTSIDAVNSHFELAWSPDGKNLAYTCKGNIWVISGEGGTSKEIKTGLDAGSMATKIGWSPDGKKIAFTAYSGGSHELYLMENFWSATPAVKPELMTTVRRLDYEWRGPFASLSPDGEYMSDRDWDTGNLVIRELATGKSQTLVEKGFHKAGSPLVSAISPDSKEIAYLWHDPNTKASSLHVVGLEGAGHRVLCKGKWVMPMDWSSDGKKILAVVLENDVWQKVWISASDGSFENIASMDKTYPGKLDVSSDGRFIAYDCPRAEDTSNGDIFVLDLSENREVSVVKHPANDKLLGWTPDGKHVFFISDRTGTWDAWLLQVANGKPKGFPRLVRHGIGNITPIGFTPQGSYYYGHEQTLIDVFVAKLDLETGQFLSEPVPVRQSGATASHDWSPDGRYLAYCEQRRDESYAIHIRTLATGRERTPVENLPYIRWLRWSQDSRSLLIDGYKRGDSQGVISKIDVKTGERTDLVRSQTEVFVRPEMSPDGKTLFYLRSKDPKSKTVLIVRDLETGLEKELFRVVPPARLTNSALSPDGQRFALSIVPNPTRPVAPVLKILSVARGEPRELIQFDKSEKLRAVGVTWTPDSRNVLFWKWYFPADKELELWRISAEGGEPRRLCSRKTFGHMRVHPDGQHVAFSDRSTMRGLWVMENFLPESKTGE